ncbi:MAG: SCO family protein [Elusimicrobiota bacterium]
MLRTVPSRPIRFGLPALLALLAGTASVVRAELVRPARAGVAVQDLAVIDEDGAPSGLRALAGGGPALLLPIFTSCAGTCPLTAEALKAAFSGRPASFRVVVLTFDPADTARDLKAFRATHGLPAAWRLARGADAAATRAFLDQFDFRVMTAPGGFDHPNETFVLSPKGVWAGTFSGSSFSQDELERAGSWALAADSPDFASRLLRRGNWIMPAFAALVLCLAAVFVLAGKASSPR